MKTNKNSGYKGMRDLANTICREEKAKKINGKIEIASKRTYFAILHRL